MRMVIYKYLLLVYGHASKGVYTIQARPGTVRSIELCSDGQIRVWIEHVENGVSPAAARYFHVIATGETFDMPRTWEYVGRIQTPELEHERLVFHVYEERR